MGWTELRTPAIMATNQYAAVSVKVWLNGRKAMTGMMQIRVADGLVHAFQRRTSRMIV